MWWMFATYEEVEVKVDYSKYLGPDWKMTFEGHGCTITNH